MTIHPAFLIVAASRLIHRRAGLNIFPVHVVRRPIREFIIVAERVFEFMQVGFGVLLPARFAGIFVGIVFGSVVRHDFSRDIPQTSIWHFDSDYFFHRVFRSSSNTALQATPVGHLTCNPRHHSGVLELGR